MFIRSYEPRSENWEERKIRLREELTDYLLKGFSPSGSVVLPRISNLRQRKSQIKGGGETSASP